jgi:hypothetical protein
VRAYLTSLTGSFELAYTDVPAGNLPYQQACPAAATLVIIRPDDLTSLRAPARIARCEGDLDVSGRPRAPSPSTDRGPACDGVPGINGRVTRHEEPAYAPHAVLLDGREARADRQVAQTKVSRTAVSPASAPGVAASAKPAGRCAVLRACPGIRGAKPRTAARRAVSHPAQPPAYRRRYPDISL